MEPQPISSASPVPSAAPSTAHSTAQNTALSADDIERLRVTILVASSARANGNHPFGSVLTDAAGTVVLEAENSVVTERDVTGHAETNLVRLAWREIDEADLPSYTLFTSCEPCAMCAGAIYWSGIGRMVFALSETGLLGLTGNHPDNPTLSLPCRDVFASGQRATVVVGPVAEMEDEAAAPHLGFWGH